jgi:two-component system chemotaxis sensor kinase CheA
VADGLDTSSLVKDYLEDARSHLDALDSSLLELEHGMGAGFDVELVNGLLGSLHTLKGNSGMMGFTTVQKFVHQLEGVFKRLLDNPALLEQNLLDALFEGATILRNSVETVGTNPQPDLSQETAFLESLAVASGGGGRTSPRRGKKASPAPERRRTSVGPRRSPPLPVRRQTAGRPSARVRAPQRPACCALISSASTIS